MPRDVEFRELAGRRYWREAEARVVVESWHRSGETLGGFARRYGLARGRLARWVSRLEGRADEGVRFHPVRLVNRGREPERGGNGAAIEIQLASARTFTFRVDSKRRTCAGSWSYSGRG